MRESVGREEREREREKGRLILDERESWERRERERLIFVREKKLLGEG